MCNSKLCEFAVDLDRYLRARCNYKSRLVKCASGAIAVNRAKVTLYLRCGAVHGFPVGSLVIANISFGRSRRGEGASLLRFIVGVADRYGIKHVVLENVVTTAGRGFASRTGFRAAEGSDHWSSSVARLIDTLRVADA